MEYLEAAPVAEEEVVEESFLAPSSEPAIPEEEQPLIANDAVGEQSFVPKNIDEQAAQLALASKADERTFEERFLAYRGQLERGKKRLALSDILIAEHEDRVGAASSYARKMVMQAELGRAETALKIKRELEAQTGKAGDTEGRSFEANKTVVARAVESVIADNGSYDYYRNVYAMDKTIDAASEDTAVRNLLMEAANSVRENASWSDVVTSIGTSIISFTDDAVLNTTVEKLTGQSFVNMYEAAKFFREWLGALEPDARRMVLGKILEDKFALFGENNARKADVLEKLATLTREEYHGITALNILGLGDVALVAKSINWLLRAGKPAVTVARTAGPDAAGKLLHQDLVNGTKLTGLDDAEQVSRALAGGLNPWELSPDAMAALSPKAQQETRELYNRLLKDTLDKLDSSGLSAEEIKEASSKLRASWLPENNPRVVSVQFGEASADGQSMLVALRRENGTYYMTQEAAERAIKEEGRPMAKAVRLRDLDNILKGAADNTVENNPRSKQIAYHGGNYFEGGFSKGKIGTGQGGAALGRGFNFTKKSDIATGFAAKYGGDPTLYKVDIPEDKLFLNWYKEWDEQSKVVQKALKNLFTPEELAKAKEEKWTGRSYFSELKKKVGESNAEKVLYENGVKGNYAHRAGDHGAVPTHVVFEPADVKVLKRTPVAPAAADVVDEAAEDADRFFLSAEGLLDDEMDRLRNMASGPDPTPFSRVGLADEEIGAVAKDISQLLSSKDTVMVTSRLPQELKGMVEAWSKLLGMDNQRVLITSLEESAVLEARFPKQFANWTSQALDANGLYSHVTLPSKKGFLGVGKNEKIHVITLNTNLVKLDKEGSLIQTLAHEYGHAFDYGILMPLMRENRKLLMTAFEKFMEERLKDMGSSSTEFVGRFRAPTRLYAEQAEEHAAGLSRPKTLNEFFNDTDDLDWFLDFREWFAENFSKFMLTDARPLNEVERFFAGISQTLRRFYNYVADRIGFRAEKPDNAVRELLSEHIENIQSGKGVKDGEDGWFFRAAFDDMLEDSGTLASKRAKKDTIKSVPAGKPRIKGKVPSGPSEQWVILEERTDPLSYDAIGKYTKEDIESMPMAAIDPKHAASEQAVEARVIGVHGEAKIQKELSEALRESFGPLSSRGKQRVLDVLEEGDAASHSGGYGKEWKSSELAAKGLSEKEMQAYFAARSVRMVSYHLRNAEMVRHLRAQGLKNIEVDGSVRAHGREYDANGAKAWAGKELWDVNAGKPVSLNAQELEAAYAGGQRIVKFSSPVEIEGRLRTLVIGDASKVKAHDIHVALGYRPGEFSRIYTDQYFVKVRGQGEVDGVKGPLEERTIRTAASAREANEFIDAVKKGVALVKAGGADQLLDQAVGKYYKLDEFKKAVAEGDFKGMDEIYSHYTRNKDEYLNNAMQEWKTHNRSFYSERGEKLLSVDPARRNTLPVMESLEAEIANISRVRNINHWREANVRRWMNTFGHLIPNRTGDDVADFYSATGGVFTRGDRESLFAERTHRYIMRQVGMSNNEEKMYETLTRQWTEKFFTRNEPVERVGAKIRDMSILGFIRNINFNLTLGMWNPAQLIVQANGAATAMVLHPIHGAKAAMSFPLLRMALMSNNEEVWRSLATAGKVASLGFAGGADEFVQVVKAVRRSGILDNMRSTSLYNREEGKFNVFGGYPSKMWETKTFFFNRGEEFARLVSFDVARREWIKANPGKAWDGQAGMHAIITRMDDYTQNMTKANLARFQEGALSIPFQFAQYNIKLAANIMSAFLGTGPGRGFSKPEALQLMVGHVLLYGAAGNGLSWLVDELLTQQQKETMSVDAKLYLGQGLLSGLLNQVGEWFTGERTAVAVGSRLGSFDYYQKLAEAAFTDPKNIYDVLFGPTVNTAKRLGSVGEIAYLWYKDDNLTGGEVLDGLGKLTTEQVSTLRNAAKAYLYYQHAGKMIDPKGFALAKITPTEMLWQALGFQPAVAVDVHRLIQHKRDHNQALDDIASLIMRIQKEWLVARKNGDEELAEQKRLTIQSLWPTNAGDFMEVQKRIKNRLYPYDTEMQKLLSENMWKGGKELPMTTTTKPRKDDGPRTY